MRPATALERVVAAVAARASHVVLCAFAAGLALAAAPASVVLGATGILITGVIARLPRLGLLAAVALALGSFAGSERIAAIEAPGSRLREGQRIEARAHLLTRPRPGPFGESAEVALASGRSRGARLLARMPREAPLEDVAVGAELELAGTFSRPRGGSGGGFDFAAHLRRRGVAGELAAERATPTGGARRGVAGALDAVRVRAADALVDGLGMASAELARGMVLGADESIAPSVREDFRDSGLAHLIAVSGQNVVLLVALAVPLLGLAGLSQPARIPVLIGLIALYVPLAGAGPSIQRAGAMGAASLAALAIARPASRVYALLLAACATLALNPLVAGDVGWQLSFAAVAGILVLCPPLRRLLSGLPAALAEGVSITVAATLATAPLLAHHFGTLSLASLPANLVALPLVAPIMWLGMLRAALGQATALGWPAQVLVDGLGLALEPLLEGLRQVAALFADMPGATLSLSLGGPLAVAGAYAALGACALLAVRAQARHEIRIEATWASLRRIGDLRLTALACAAAALVALALAQGLSPPGPPGSLTVTFLDVGQGDATLVQHPDGTAVLFDGGPPEGSVARLLRRAGVRRLSVLVMTHASRDHHGGLREVVERFPIGVLLDGGDGTRDRGFRSIAAEAVSRGARRVAATAPLAIRSGAVSIDVLSPPPREPGPPPEDPNPRAVAAIVESGGFELLLSADAESPTLSELALPDVDAMKLPHHGSADPGLPEILERLRPEAAAITVGSNTYGHPAPSTLSALRRAGVPTWRTDRDGSVRLVVERGRLRVLSDRGAVEVEP